MGSVRGADQHKTTAQTRVARSGLTFFNPEIRVKTWAEFYKFGPEAMPARILGLNVLALLVGTSKAVPLQMVLGLTLEGCAGSHRDHWLPIILPEGGLGLLPASRGRQKNPAWISPVSQC